LEDIHLFMIGLLNNNRLDRSYAELAAHNRRVLNHLGKSLSRQRIDQVVADHLEILDSLGTEDPERAEAAVQKHLRGAAAYLLGLLISAQ